MGHPIHGRQHLIAASPYFQTEDIKTPLFIAHGMNDSRVVKKHAEQMIEALKKSNKVFDFMFKENEGHIFVKEENNFDFYRKVELFLQKYLGNPSSE